MDELIGNNLFSLRGEKWRQMRTTLTPFFTGSKMRQMFEFVSECADQIVQHFQKRAVNGERIDIEMKDLFSRYTNDVIATCAFGVKVDSMENPNNEFYVNGKKLSNYAAGCMKLFKFFIIILLPRVAQIFKMNFFDVSIKKFFKDMILNTMSTRQKNNIYRPDLINTLMQVRQENLTNQEAGEQQKTDDLPTITKKWNDNEIIAQCFLFFFAGFEASSLLLMFIAYELVANPEIQQKLYDEIAEVNEQLQGKRITYDILQKMKYLEQVISEALRKWPIGGQIDRHCVKDYIYDDGKLKFKIERGSNILFPTYGIHKDPIVNMYNSKLLGK